MKGYIVIPQPLRSVYRKFHDWAYRVFPIPVLVGLRMLKWGMVALSIILLASSVTYLSIEYIAFLMPMIVAVIFLSCAYVVVYQESVYSMKNKKSDLKRSYKYDRQKKIEAKQQNTISNFDEKVRELKARYPDDDFSDWIQN